MHETRLRFDSDDGWRFYWKLILLHIGRQTNTLRLVWAAAAVAVIVGSLLPGDSSAMQTISALHVNDKIQHGFAYAVLAWLPVLHERRRIAMAMLVVVAALGVLLEFGQLYVPERSFDTHDMIADCVGAAIGAVIGLRLRPLVSPHKEPCKATTL